MVGEARLGASVVSNLSRYTWPWVFVVSEPHALTVPLGFERRCIIKEKAIRRNPGYAGIHSCTYVRTNLRAIGDRGCRNPIPGGDVAETRGFASSVPKAKKV